MSEVARQLITEGWAKHNITYMLDHDVWEQPSQLAQQSKEFCNQNGRALDA